VEVLTCFQVSHGAYAERVNELVCLDMPCSQTFVDRIKRAWDHGDAIFPLDQRLPQPAREAVLNAIRPTRIATETDEVSYNGEPVELGDAVVVATSGTTGTQKGVVLTHSAVEASARATSERLNVESSDKWLACLPVSHVGGLSVVLRSLVMGTPLITASQFSIEAYNNAAQSGATLVSLVSTALQRVDPSLYRTVVLGGAKPPSDRPTNTVTTYGLTETGSGVVYDGLPLSGVEIEVRESVVFLRAPMLLRSYRDGTIPLTSNGWFRTGDVGSFADGIVSIEGREGDLIITGGENVWPDTVEEILRTHPFVEDVCVAGIANNEWGQQVTSWIVPKGNSTISLDEVRDYVKQFLPAHCAPREVIAVNSIPRTALGKPQRAVLVASVDY
jgi:O-succinylbenzoic acid--CoA ligase